MAFVYARGDSQKLWCSYVDAGGVRRRIATPFTREQEDLAQRFADELERQAKLGADPETGTLTFRLYAKKWVTARRDRGVAVDDDETRIARYATPGIGALALSDIRPRHVRDLVLALKAKVGPADEQLAPRTVRHIFGTLHTMFEEAVVDELIASNPCVLKRGDLPPRVDKDPTWRAGAVFTREEVETLISSPKVPDDRRVLYALLFLTGARFGEVAALRWSAYDKARKPLAHLLIAKSFNTRTRTEKSTKTQVTREVPVHRTLARVLAAWRLSGWQRFLKLGRAPTSDDLIIPFKHGGHRVVQTALLAFVGDLERLKLRRRRQHDARRTFITLARRDGARADILEAITHGPRGDIMNLYTSLPWELLCEEVAKLKVELRGASEGIVLPMVASARGPQRRGHDEGTDVLRPYHGAQNVAVMQRKSGDPYGIRTSESSGKVEETAEENAVISRSATSGEGSDAPSVAAERDNVTSDAIAAALEAAQRSCAAGDVDGLTQILRGLLDAVSRVRP